MSSAVVPEVRPLSRAAIEREAENMLRAYSPERLSKPGPVDVVSLLEDVVEDLKDTEDVQLRIEKMAPGEEGALHPNGVVVLSEETYNGAVDGEPRPRFTVGHETGHFALHRHQMRRAFVERDGVSFFRRDDLKPFLDPEWQANAYSAALLMPAVTVKKFVTKYGPAFAILEIEDQLQVSHTAAQYRVADFLKGKLSVK